MSYDDAQITMTGVTRDILAKAGVYQREPLNVYSSSIQGFAVNLSDSEVAALEKNPNVRGIWPDMMFIMAKPAPSPVPLPSPEVVPPGITEGWRCNRIYRTQKGVDHRHRYRPRSCWT